MKKIFITLSFFLLIARLTCFGQIYPRFLIVEKDSLVAITVGQMVTVNLTFEDLRYYKQKSDSLQSIITTYKRSSSSKDRLLDNLRKQLQTSKNVLVDKDEIIKLKDSQIAADGKRIRWLKLSRFVCFSAMLVFGGFWLLK